jgi:hypothetical protein
VAGELALAVDSETRNGGRQLLCFQRAISHFLGGIMKQIRAAFYVRVSKVRGQQEPENAIERFTPIRRSTRLAPSACDSRLYRPNLEILVRRPHPKLERLDEQSSLFTAASV